MKHIIALDIGGTKIEGVLFNDKLKCLKKKRVYYGRGNDEVTINLSRAEVLSMIETLICELKGKKKIFGIGVSIPDVVNKQGALQGTSKITALSNFPLGAHLKRKFKCRVTVNNDADCFALGEAMHGAGKGHENVIGVIYGTGIGAGLVLNGKLYTGATGSCGEFGRSVVDPNGPSDRTGMRGTVEAYAGGGDLVRNYLRFGGKMKHATTKEIYRSKEKAAKKAMDLALEHLCIGLSTLWNVLNPGIIVMGGGQSNLPVYRELNKRTKKYTIDGLQAYVKIVKNKLGDSAGIYGAAYQILS